MPKMKAITVSIKRTGLTLEPIVSFVSDSITFVKSYGSLLLFFLELSLFLITFLLPESGRILFEMRSDERISKFCTKGDESLSISHGFSLASSLPTESASISLASCWMDTGMTFSKSMKLLKFLAALFLVEPGLIGAIVSSYKVESSTALNDATFKLGKLRDSRPAARLSSVS